MQPGTDAPTTIHATCVARGNSAVLLTGRSGSGKSDLALRLLDRGFDLVADDRVIIEGAMASPPPSLAGLLEVRGLGLLRVPCVHPVRLALIVVLDKPAERLPEPTPHPIGGVPALHLSPWQISAPLLVEVGLECVLGRRRLEAGFLVDRP